MVSVITVENISKKYIISHERDKANYKTFRDEIAHFFIKTSKNILKTKKNIIPNREEFWALKDISFDVKQGDRLGIIGRNGAGKSTLLKVLSRITDPTAGKITIKGRISSLLEVGTGFHPELTGRENIYLNGAILGMGRAEIKKKFDEIVAFSEVERFLDTPVKRYSSGMYVRLAFSVAAHLEPEILIVDEVLAVGDAQFQKKCLGKMESVSTKDGKTILFVSHNMAAIKSLCTKGIYLENGNVVNYNSIDSIVNEYMSKGNTKNTILNFKIAKNKKAQFLSYRLLDQNNNETCNFYPDSPPIVEMEYILNEPVIGMHVACMISTVDGFDILSTADTDDNEHLFNRREKGRYITRLKIPADHFNTGTYCVAVGMGIPGGVELFDRREGLNFEMNANGEYGPMKEVYNRYGLLLMRIPWNVKAL